MSRRGSIQQFSLNRSARDRHSTWRSAASILLFLSLAGVPAVALAGSAAMVACGTVYDHDRLTVWPDQDTLRVEILRTGLSGIAIIGEMDPGAYAGALVDLGGGTAAAEGDTLRFALTRMVGVVLDSLHVVTAAEAEEGMAFVDLFVASASSGAADLPVVSGPALRIFPNPARGDRITFMIRSRATLNSEGLASSVELTILDAGGREICTRRGELVAGGVEVIHWDGRANDGRRAAQGVYFASVRSRDIRLVGRLLLMP